MTDQPGMTENNARTRWCPFARSYHEPPTFPANTIASGTNRKSGGEPNQWCLCIASDCMAWRVLGEYYSPAAGYFEPHGFCGLAGKSGIGL